IRIAFADDACKLLEMTARPDVVVPEIGDVGSACKANAFVVRGRLAARISREIRPPDAIGEMRGHHVCGIVGTPVSNDDDLEVTISLVERRADRRNDPACRVVRGDDDRKMRHLADLRRTGYWPREDRGTQGLWRGAEQRVAPAGSMPGPLVSDRIQRVAQVASQVIDV